MTPEIFWKKIETLISVESPETVKALPPPASKQALDALEKVAGFPLPKDFRALYGGHDGTAEGLGIFPDGLFLPLASGAREKMQEVSKQHKVSDFTFDEGIKETVYDPKWIPFALLVPDEAFVCYDGAPTRDGNPGQVILVDYGATSVELMADDLSDFLDAQMASIEQQLNEEPAEKMTLDEPLRFEVDGLRSWNPENIVDDDVLNGLDLALGFPAVDDNSVTVTLYSEEQIDREILDKELFLARVRLRNGDKEVKWTTKSHGHLHLEDDITLCASVYEFDEKITDESVLMIEIDDKPGEDGV